MAPMRPERPVMYLVIPLADISQFVGNRNFHS